MTRKQKHLAKRIRELTLSGTKASHIARILQCTNPTVRKYQRRLLGLRRVDHGAGLHAALGVIDKAFDSPLPFAAQHDVAVATTLLEALTKRYPSLYRQATEKNLGELHGLLAQALSVKRIFADTGTVH